MDTLADILAIEFAGNYQDDKAKFARIDAFLRRPDVDPDTKFKADYHASFNGMGEPIEHPGADYYNTFGQ